MIRSILDEKYGGEAVTVGATCPSST